jgi:hypothetical protein
MLAKEMVMGSGSWSNHEYTARSVLRAKTNTPTFAYHEATEAKPRGSRTAHDSLSAKGLKMRESRDSDEHPNSVAVAVGMDQTGSMREVPKIIQAALPKLMGLLLRKGGLADPQILIGGIGDAFSDDVPLQIGQFESDIRIEEDITNLFLEGNGGGGSPPRESYELFMYAMARHTVTDCWEKRKKKGYLFIIGDEQPYALISPDQVEKHIGDTLEAAIPTETIVRELQERYEVYYIQPNMTYHYKEAGVVAVWRDLLGENVVFLDKPEAICETIASVIAFNEGSDMEVVKSALHEAGTDLAVVGAVENALAGVAKKTAKTGAELTAASSGAGTGIETL